ncbi:hypothetical protein [Gorillibacterium sp. sgz5001074]|uniref:hypothetical protein n=1 Tax=Gorillibacterium sp. sgz5001074 TaxID=3446695 RepID=UPI003F66CAA1
MQMIASYPIQAEACLPHCGKAVMAVTHDGDTIIGILDGVRDGNVYFKSLYTSEQAEVLARKLAPKSKKAGAKPTKPVRTQAFGLPGFGYPGIGYPGIGYPGAGLGFFIPLLLLATLFALPFIV